MITYKVVGYDHPICGFTCPRGVDKNMRRFWNSRSLENSHKAVVAYDGKKLIGFFRWNIFNDENEMAAYGTYVLADYRKKGVAVKLWAKALRHQKPRKVTVYTTSYGGRKLTSALKKKFTKYDWYIHRIS